MTYQLWTVFEDNQTRFYVVNMATRQVQSTWKNLFEARTTCDKLNLVAKGA